jgi:hypothetical protein
LVARDARSTVPAILSAAQDADAAVRQEAIRALGKLADAAAGPRVIALLDNAADRTAVEAALVAIYRRAGNCDAVAAATAAGPKQASLLTVLGALGGEKALAVLRAALKSPDGAIRRTAALALGGWKDAAPLNDLIAISTTDGDATTRVLALRGVAHLVPLADDRETNKLCATLERAIRSASGPEEIKPLLSAMGHLPCASAARLAASYLKDSAVADEAALAIVEMGALRSGRDRAAVFAAVRQVAASCPNPLIRARAEAIPPEENLALGGVATNPDGLVADGEAGGPQAAIDGNSKTYWDEVDGQKLYQLRVQLKQPATVTGIRIEGYVQQVYAPKDFEVLCDGKVVKRVRDAQYRKNHLTVSLPPTACASVELKITGYYGGSPAIRELEIFGTPQ